MASPTPSNKAEAGGCVAVRSRPLVLYIVNRGEATVVKEWGTVHLTLGGSGVGVVSHHSSCSLFLCWVVSKKGRRGSNKKEGHRRHGSSLIDVDPSGGGVGTGETCRTGGGSIILLPFVQS
jgi:hypothetical protein